MVLVSVGAIVVTDWAIIAAIVVMGREEYREALRRESQDGRTASHAWEMAEIGRNVLVDFNNVTPFIGFHKIHRPFSARSMF